MRPADARGRPLRPLWRTSAIGSRPRAQGAFARDAPGSAGPAPPASRRLPEAPRRTPQLGGPRAVNGQAGWRLPEYKSRPAAQPAIAVRALAVVACGGALASCSYRRSRPVRILQEPGLRGFGRGPEVGARRPGGPPSLFSQLMGGMQSHLDEMDRLRVVLLHAHPLLAPGEEAGPAGQGRQQPRQPRAQSGHQLALDVGGFSPGELSVKLEGRKLTVLGKHEEAAEAEDGCVSRESREVRRELLLPADANLEAVTCALAHDGQLRIDAPRLERTIPVAVERSPAEPGEAADRQKSPGGGEERGGAGEK